MMASAFAQRLRATWRSFRAPDAYRRTQETSQSPCQSRCLQGSDCPFRKVETFQSWASALPLCRWVGRRFWFLGHRSLPLKRFASILAEGLVSRPVRETLALDTLHGKQRTFPIVDPEGDKVRIAEIKLGKVAMQMLLRAVARSGWVEPFAKPIIFASPQLMGVASLPPSYAPERANARASCLSTVPRKRWARREMRLCATLRCACATRFRGYDAGWWRHEP
jgi:hypothetical protein